MSTPRQDATAELEHTGKCAGYKCDCQGYDHASELVVAESVKPLYRYCKCGHVQGTHEKPAEPAEESKP